MDKTLRLRVKEWGRVTVPQVHCIRDVMRYLSTEPTRSCYSTRVTPSRRRDLSRAEVWVLRPPGGWDLDNVAEVPGGELHGGPFEVLVDDPALPALVRLTVKVEGGRPICDRLMVDRRPGAGPVSGETLRKIPVDSFLRSAVAGHPFLSVPIGPNAGGLARPGERKQVERAQERRDSQEVMRQVVGIYREALRDPARRARATAATAEALHLSRGYASLLLTRARDAGLLTADEIGRGGRPRPRTPQQGRGA